MIDEQYHNLTTKVVHWCMGDWRITSIYLKPAINKLNKSRWHRHDRPQCDGERIEGFVAFLLIFGKCT